MKLGVQLYTVRKAAENVNDLGETLKRIADMGYTTVQASGICPFEPAWMREQLEKNGLRCVLTHVPYDRLRDETEAVIREHEVFNCKNIGLGNIPGSKFLTDELYEQFVKDYKPTVKKMQEAGAKFFFHNHYMEFKKSGNGVPYIWRMVEDFSPEELRVTLDTYWVQFAGADVCDTMRALSGRLECIHLKDMVIWEEDRTHRMAPVGHGNMNFEKIVQVAADCGTEYLLVEQDKCYDEDPFVCLQKSYDYLRSLGLN